MKDFWEWVHLLNEAAAQYMDAAELAKRLQKLGWTISTNGSHQTAYAPDGIGMITWTVNNWEKNWHQVARDLLRFAKGGRGKGGYTDLEFVWQHPFVIPPNFNYKKQEIEKPDTIQKVMVSKLLINPGLLQGKEVQWGDVWKRVELADHGTDGISIDAILDDGSTINLPMQQVITMRAA